MFRDRTEAGRVLAGALKEYEMDSPLVLAIPRGGVVVGREVALALGAPLDVVMAKKIGAPYNPEFAIAAAGPDGKVLFSPDIRDGTPRSYVMDRAAEVRKAIERSLAAFRSNRPEKPIQGMNVVVVDDGLATGLTAMAALQYIRRKDPRRLFLAVPVAPQETIESLEPLVDGVICPLRPPVFYSVGEWYISFDQISDEEVRRILDEFAEKTH
ncbi:MAG: phosphoribosyltransferase [Bacillota bacterium]|jgi:putative phosphoribosyl transferase|nr:phosphoribosyltransferase [Candidatus Fermentithermobacillaceae bacterium]